MNPVKKFQFLLCYLWWLSLSDYQHHVNGYMSSSFSSSATFRSSQPFLVNSPHHLSAYQISKNFPSCTSPLEKVVCKIQHWPQFPWRTKLCMVTSSSSSVEDVPLPTENGGYSHTKSSKAKISAANKGKTPWNKGRQRSEEEKARIAEGVRRRNREKFLAKLADLGLTEEEYEAQKKEERRKKDAERRARKTAKGGYTPTEETKAKISSILKEKWAKGEIKKRDYSGPFRKGFTHSEETKEKIRQALKKKWAEDPDYQEKMRKNSNKNSESEMRTKISKTLKEKWKDPEFRAKMMEKMKTRRKPAGGLRDSQRKKISEAMKLKWQDSNYRNKALEGMEKHRKTTTPTSRKKSTKKRVPGIQQVTPRKKKTTKKSTTTINGSTQTTSTVKASRKVARPKAGGASAVDALTPKSSSSTTKKKKKKKKKKSEPDSSTPSEEGDIQRLREERRDLFDLLYGDDPGFLDNDDDDDDGDFFMSSIPTAAAAATSSRSSSLDLLDDPYVNGAGVNGGGYANGKKLNNNKSSFASLLGDSTDFDDDNLDDFDPYGLEDF